MKYFFIDYDSTIIYYNHPTPVNTVALPMSASSDFLKENFNEEYLSIDCDNGLVLVFERVFDIIS